MQLRRKRPKRSSVDSFFFCSSFKKKPLTSRSLSLSLLMATAVVNLNLFFKTLLRQLCIKCCRGIIRTGRFIITIFLMDSQGEIFLFFFFFFFLFVRKEEIATHQQRCNGFAEDKHSSALDSTRLDSNVALLLLLLLANNKKLIESLSRLEIEPKLSISVTT